MPPGLFYLTAMTTISEIQVSYRPKMSSRTQITSANEAYETLLPLFPEETIQLQERFVVLYLNRANKVIGSYQLSTGGLAGTIADIRLILSVGLKCMASSIILAHNHPSGVMRPSEADRKLTSKIKEAAALMDIEVLDHIILGPNEYFSFAEQVF